MCELVSDKSLCCGCSACYDACPKSAITMIEDKEGFLYPAIDEDKCIDCKLCEKVCPTKNKKKNKSLLEAYAAYNTDENIRLKSSSGGVFSLIAEYVLRNQGVVYGAAFDENFEVEHLRVASVEELELLRGSKYVQSKLDGIYNLCKKDLEIGKQVLFTGTPCQVSGLKSFLRKEYDNLVCMDIVCHGVPSRMVWRKYLEYRINFAKSKIVQIAFRLKNEGWTVSPGALPLEKQLERSYLMEFEYDANQYPKYIMANAQSIAENYDAAKTAATSLAITNLAGQIQTEVTALVENTVANKQLDPEDAASITETVMASKNLISQSIGRVITVVECYRVLPNKNREVMVRIAYNGEMAKEVAKKAIRQELEKKGEKLHEQLDKALGL